MTNLIRDFITSRKRIAELENENARLTVALCDTQENLTLAEKQIVEQQAQADKLREEVDALRNATACLGEIASAMIAATKEYNQKRNRRLKK